MPVRPLRVVFAVMAVCALCAQAGVPASAAARQVVTGAQVAAIADRIARGAVTGADKSIAPAYQLPDQSLPAGTLAIAPAGAPFVTPTYLSVPVDIRVDGRLARTVVAGYRVTTYVETAVTTRDLTPGAVIEASDLAPARIASNGRPAVGIDALVGRKLNAATPKGAPLYVEQTVADTLVKAGQSAILIVHDGPVALTADVVARTGGALGETVTVYNAQTRKSIGAIVTGRNQVELTLPGGE